MSCLLTGFVSMGSATQEEQALNFTEVHSQILYGYKSCMMNRDRSSLSVLRFTSGQSHANFILKTPPPPFEGQTRSFPTLLSTKRAIRNHRLIPLTEDRILL